MIHTYRKLAIIYGGQEGKNIAKALEKELLRLHEDEYYPVKPMLIAESLLGSNNLFEKVKELINSAYAAVTIFSFEDEIDKNHPELDRVRPNVLIELAMALQSLGNERCYVLSCREHLPESFPSDLKTSIQHNYNRELGKIVDEQKRRKAENEEYYNSDRHIYDEPVKEICTALLKKMNIPSHKGIIFGNCPVKINGEEFTAKYNYDYSKVLDDIPSILFEKNTEEQLSGILDIWQKNIDSFDFIEEKIVYLLERINCFPIFDESSNVREYLRDTKHMIESSENKFMCLEFDEKYKDYVISTLKCTSDILEYSELKLRKEVKKLITAKEKNTISHMQYKDRFLSLAQSMESLINKFEGGCDDDFPYFWLMKVMTYQFASNAYVRFLDLGGAEDRAEAKEIVDKIIGYYTAGNELRAAHNSTENKIWAGYLEYNLARAYKMLYDIDGNDSTFKKMKDHTHQAIIQREAYFLNNPFHGAFNSAFAYEYFLAYELQCRMMAEYSEQYEKLYRISKDSIDMYISELKDSIDIHCASSGFRRLLEIRDNADNMLS